MNKISKKSGSNKLKNNIEIIALIIVAVLTKLYFLVFKKHYILWDETVYIGISKWFSSFGSLGLYEQIRPPVLPLSISFFRLFTDNEIIAANLAILLFTTCCIFMTYLIGKKLYNKKVGLIGSLLLFVTPVFFFYSYKIMSSIPALFFILLSVYFSITKRYLLAGLFSGITFLTRFPAGLIVPIINLIIVHGTISKFKVTELPKIFKEIFKEKTVLLKRLLVYNITFACIFAAFLIYNKILNGSFIEPLILASHHQSTLIGNHSGLDYFLFYPMTVLFTNAILLVSIYIIFNEKLRENNKLSFIGIPFFVLFIYFMIIPHKQDRFIILLLPFLTLFAGYAIYNIFKKCPHKYFNYLLAFTIVLIIAQPMGINVYQMHVYPNYTLNGHDVYYGYLEKLDNNMVILTSDPTPVAYTNHKYIPFYQDTEEGLWYVKQYIDEADIVIYDPSAFPWTDPKSTAEKKEILEIIHSKGKLIHNATYNGVTKEIWLIE